MTNLERERAILRMVYDELAFEPVVKRERPDFELRRRGISASFGVEVTELYDTESDARIRNHPKYVSHLLCGGAHMDKNDVSTLKVERVAIHDANNIEKATDVPVIIYQLPTVRQRVSSIARIIEQKDEKVPDYVHGLSHVNLIVMDRSRQFSDVTRELLASHLLMPELKSALLRTEFREVFFIAKIEEHRVLLRLKMLLLMSEFSFFTWALASYKSAPDDVDPNHVVSAFADFMTKAGMPLRLTALPDGRLSATFGNSGVSLDTDGTRIILDHNDSPERSGPAADAPDTAFVLGEDFREHYARFVRENEFATDLLMNALTDVEF